MGHVLGMNHDVGPDLEADYSDPCCVMSQNNPFTPPAWGRNFGPAVCLAHLMQQSWMHEHRVYVADESWANESEGITVPLAPIGNPSARGNLGIKLAYSNAGDSWDYYVEYVEPAGWNQGILKPYVFIRRMSPKYGGTPAYLGLIAAPSQPGDIAEFVEAAGNVRFRIRLTDLPGPIMAVNAKKL